MNLLQHADAFAVKAHGEQKRKYTGDPYIVHPRAVANTLARHGMPEYVQAAGLLHDVVEDTPVTLDDIRAEFGDIVATLVGEVTDVAKPGDGNRAFRVAKNREHAARATYYGAAIKLANLIDNTTSIVTYDPNFAKVYLPEKRAVLEVLRHGPPTLVYAAYAALTMAEAKIAGKACCGEVPVVK